jgi:hypothetical protein
MQNSFVFVWFVCGRFALLVAFEKNVKESGLHDTRHKCKAKIMRDQTPQASLGFGVWSTEKHKMI